MTVTVNDNASGAWARRVGTELEYVGPGANKHHVEVRRPGEKRTMHLPTSWLDGDEVDGVVESVCPTCGRPLPVGES